METVVNPSKETLEVLKKLIVEVMQSEIELSSIRDNANLFNDCGLDSTSVIDLVLSIEEKFGISIDDDELVVSVFQDLSMLCSLVETKQLNVDPV